jgi:hypothetical protein
VFDFSALADHCTCLLLDFLAAVKRGSNFFVFDLHRLAQPSITINHQKEMLFDLGLAKPLDKMRATEFDSRNRSVGHRLIQQK